MFSAADFSRAKPELFLEFRWVQRNAKMRNRAYTYPQEEVCNGKKEQQQQYSEQCNTTAHDLHQAWLSYDPKRSRIADRKGLQRMSFLHNLKRPQTTAMQSLDQCQQMSTYPSPNKTLTLTY